MAAKKNSLAVGLAALIAGLCLGVAGMSVLIGPDWFWEPHKEQNAYQPRSDLTTLSQSPRVKAELVQSARDVDVRNSDPLRTIDHPRPVRLVISSIGVDATVEAVGLEPDTSSLQSEPGRESEPGDRSTVAVPGRTEAGWYRFGSSPGQPGATVLAGHVDLGGQHGVFWDLTELKSGAIIEVHLSDGSTASYRTMRGTDFSRDSLPSDQLFRQDGAPALHLITCGGAFNRNLGRYESNYVVTAAPIYQDA